MHHDHDKNEKKITLLCDSCSSCPEVTINKKGVVITDDFGGKVKLTREQFGILKDKIRQEQV